MVNGQLADGRSLISIERMTDSTMIDVRDLPATLRDAGCTIDMLPEECRSIPQFLARVKVETLDAIKIQIVETSEATVPTRTLQKFLLAAADQLGDIKVICEGNAECSLAASS
ncbi:hypothetical protein FOZ63_000357 [Perkinsus olseni]|uniref:Uncharacterized protein n=1 Tax=Perkinsus olseni TaxID=32597 RepID=A0A7J6NKV7_PEROL|nr:hypothetical protein FOZ60_008292 [Perkinsus olseni]KAF4707814.1 hypothetical protein FOZ63_000357 [Perkinsus olseni]KAF4728998.1 hypothetical protein FOZ62_023841 [Perkinsus olseni]